MKKLILPATAITAAIAPLSATEKKAPLEVSIEVPNPTWSTKIKEVYKKSDKLLVVCQMTQKEGMGIMVISKAKDKIELPEALTKLDKEIFVLGKKWNWNNGGYTETTPEKLKATLKGATKVYQAKEANKKTETDANFVGLTVEEARKLATGRKLLFRIVERDGQQFRITKDFRRNRVNVKVTKGKVTEANRG